MVAIAVLIGGAIPEREPNGLPHLRSESVLVRYADTGEVLLSKLPGKVRPIASITKLLTGLVLAELDATTGTAAIQITERDKDRLKWSRSRLKVGRTFSRTELYQAALAASDNRAVYALVRSTGLSRADFVRRMNARAKKLGMTRSKFADPAGVDPGNVSCARDLLALIQAAAAEDVVRRETLRRRVELMADGKTRLRLGNPNRLARRRRWGLVLGKTGYTVEAGRTLAVRVTIDGRPVDMVFLGSREMMSVFGDAGRVRRWIRN